MSVNPVVDPLEPINPHACTVIHLNAGNDANGNPRRAFLVLYRNHVVGCVDEGYDGEQALNYWGKPLGDMLRRRIALQLDVTPGQYRQALKWKRSMIAYKEQP